MEIFDKRRQSFCMKALNSITVGQNTIDDRIRNAERSLAILDSQKIAFN